MLLHDLLVYSTLIYITRSQIGFDAVSRSERKAHVVEYHTCLHLLHIYLYALLM